jgi:hypothetical protein
VAISNAEYMKEYLNKNEASDYMCLSLRGFSRLVKEWRIPSAKVPGGRIIYRKSDLKNLNERFFDAPEMKLQV